MDTEIRLVKVEKEVDSLTALVEKNSQAITELRNTMERRFSEEHAWAERQFAELRKENNTNFRWMMGTFLTGFLFLLGLMGRIAGLY